MGSSPAPAGQRQQGLALGVPKRLVSREAKELGQDEQDFQDEQDKALEYPSKGWSPSQEDRWFYLLRALGLSTFIGVWWGYLVNPVNPVHRVERFGFTPLKEIAARNKTQSL